MANIRACLTRIQSLFTREQYHRALREVERSGIAVLEKAGRSQYHSDLLLLVGRVYYANHRYDGAWRYLFELERLYPTESERIDAVLLRLMLLLREGRTKEARFLLEKTFGESASHGQSALYLFYRGMVRVCEGKCTAAHRNFLACHRLACAAADRRLRGDALYMLGYLAFRRARLDTAEEYLCAAADIFDADSRGAMLAAAFRLRGIAAARNASPVCAHKYIDRSRQLYRACGDGRGIVAATLASARVLVYCDECERAEQKLLIALRVARRMNFGSGIVQVCSLLADSCNQQQRHDEALQHLQATEQHLSGVPRETAIHARYLRVKGETLLAVGRLEEAAEILERALDLSGDIGDECGVGTSMRALGSLSMAEGDIDGASVFFDDSITHLDRSRNVFELFRSCMVAGRACLTWGNDEALPEYSRLEFLRKGRRYLMRALELSESCNPRSKQICEVFLERIESECNRLESSKRYTVPDFDTSWVHYGMVVARSMHMKEVISKVCELAPSTVPVLITGETGTGKEVIARLLHRLSERSGGPFIAVNCASIPDTVFESELFGYKRGSFTGAFKDKMGLIEQASMGTIFLDEISELTNQQQAKLLRALQDGMIRRVGETIERPIDVRVISASNDDIEMLRRSNRLREDFYYRISVATIELAPLRERTEDISALFAYFLHLFGGRCAVEDGVLELLMRYRWPGNVRELLGVVRVMALQGKRQGAIHIHTLPLRIINSSILDRRRGKGRKRPSDSSPPRVTKKECMKNPKEMRELIELYLDKYRGNKSAVARELGISRCTLYRRLRELHIRPEDA